MPLGALLTTTAAFLELALWSGKIAGATHSKFNKALLVKCPSVQWQLMDLTSHTKKWFLRAGIVVRVLGWDMSVPGSIPADVNYTGYASDTSKSLGECLRLRSNHNVYLNGRLAESNEKNKNTYVCVYIYIYT